MSRPTRAWLLGAARDWLWERVGEGGVSEKCPLCTQNVHIYDKRQVHSTIARALCLMYRAGGTDWVHVPTIVSGSCELGKARYWGLVEEEQQLRPDGGRAGWWRLTDKGASFVRGDITIAKYVRVYDGKQYGPPYGDQVSIQDCLGTKFHLGELLGRVGAS